MPYLKALRHAAAAIRSGPDGRTPPHRTTPRHEDTVHDR